jgi:protein TonB
MKRRFAVPAAIALTAHALIFMGSGKPPVPPSNGVVIDQKADENRKTEEEDIYSKALELTKNEPVVAPPVEKSGGGSSEEAPPEIPEIPRPLGPSERWEITQNPAPVISGHGKITTNLGVRVPGNGDGTGFGDVSVSVGMLDKVPHTLFQRKPIYPNMLKAAGETGTVWVDFMVDERGYVHDARVVKSTNPGFNDVTLAAVSEWRFEPGKRKGIPVCFRMSLPMVFDITS